jgi:hypothetical protein
MCMSSTLPSPYITRKLGIYHIFFTHAAMPQFQQPQGPCELCTEILNCSFPTGDAGEVSDGQGTH